VAPKREQKVLISAAESSDEMIFEGADGLFGSIGTLDAHVGQQIGI
jgi:hypothetical protein